MDDATVLSIGDSFCKDYNTQMSFYMPEPAAEVKQVFRKKLVSEASAMQNIEEGAPESQEFLEFFAGSGLVAEGLKGFFKAVWANDICEKKADVYTANHDSNVFHRGSIADVRGSDLPPANMAWASFPCQDLSLAGLAGGIHASRSGLVWEWLRIIDEMPNRPSVLVAENVIGLVSGHEGRHYKALHNALVERGYRVGSIVLDAKHWVPQSRPRVFIVAVRSDINVLSDLVTTGPTWLHPKSVQKAAQGLSDWIWWKLPEPLPRLKGLSDIIEWDAPFADESAERRNLALISEKHRKVLEAIPDSNVFVAPGYRRTRYGKQVLELRFDDLAGCLRTPEGGSSRQVVVIKKDGLLRTRLITTREAARLMGAPDSYVLPGSYNDGYKAMGDAVAVPVAQWLAKFLLLPLVRSHGEC